MKINILKSQRGAILPLLAIAIVAIIGLVAIMIDVSRSSYTVNTIQEAADTASISAVRQLNGTEDGWIASRSAALLAIQSNQINGVPAGALNNLVLNANSQYGDNTLGVAGGLKVIVARGIYWFDPATEKKKFVSLEEGADNGNGPWNNLDFTKQIFADAVKIDLTLAKIDNSGFSKLSGKESYENLEKSSIAISDNQLKLPSFPAGVSYCQLMGNMDANQTQNHLLSSYNPELAGSRELILTELAGFVTGANQNSELPTASQERREGFRRYLWSIYNPVYENSGPNNVCGYNSAGKGVNCKNTPIRGLLGVAGATSGYASIEELQNLGQNAQVGQYFKPLKEWPADEVAINELSEKIKQFMANTNATVNDVFIDHSDPNGRLYAKRNFPAVRNSQVRRLAGGVMLPVADDTDFFRRPAIYNAGSPLIDYEATNRINWPIEIAGREFIYSMVLGLNREPGEIGPSNAQSTYAPFINPLCNSSEENLDRSNYKIRRFNVMVIAPGSEQGGVSYCDFDNQFQGQPQNSEVPYPPNLPTIVGVVPVDFVGYNIKPLGNDPIRFNDINNPGNFVDDGGQASPATRLQLLFGSDSRPDIEQYEDEYNDCINDKRNNLNQNPNECDVRASDNNLYVPSEVRDCFTINNSLLNFRLNQIQTKSNDCESKKPPDCSGKQDSYNNKNAQCQQINQQCASIDQQANPSGYSNCMNSLSQCNAQASQKQQELNQCISVFNVKNPIYQDCLTDLANTFNLVTIITQLRLAAIDDKHCLPLPIEDAYDFNSSRSYERLTSLRAGRGCGGIRGRVAEDGNGLGHPMLTNGKAWETLQPTIVENDN